MLLTFALLSLNAAPPWLELGHETDGGIEAPSIADSGQLSTALVVKQVADSGGTMHSSSKTVISCERCARPLVLPSMALIHHVIDLGESRFLLLGWSSGGGGMQRVHALLVRLNSGGPAMLDELVWTTTRSERGILLVSTPEGWRIGLPQPRLRTEEWMERLDTESDLRVTSGRTRSAVRLEKAGFFTPIPAGLTAFSYCPPFGEGVRVRTNVGWMRVTASGFRVAP